MCVFFFYSLTAHKWLLNVSFSVIEIIIILLTKANAAHIFDRFKSQDFLNISKFECVYS